MIYFRYADNRFEVVNIVKRGGDVENFFADREKI